MRILHIENEPEYVMFLKENLEPFGFEIINILSPDDAIEHYRQNKGTYDIIICDGDPGLLEGARVIRELRNIDLYIPIIAQWDFPNYIEKMFNSGANWSIPRSLKESDFPKFFNLLRELALRFPKK